MPTRYVFNRQGKLLEHHAILKRTKTGEKGYFTTYQYVGDEVRQTLNITLDTQGMYRSWLGRQWDALASQFGLSPSDSPPAGIPGLEAPNFQEAPGFKTPAAIAATVGQPQRFIKVLKRDEHGNPIELDTWESPNMEASKRRETRTIGYR